MNEEPKSIWKKSWKGPRAFLFWLLIVLVAALFVAVTITFMIDRHGGWESFVESVLAAMVIFVVMTAVAFALYKIIRWLCCWRNFKQFLFGLACFITLIALFYAEEDWRGWHAWNKFKREWEAKGERFDRASVVPPSVPDDQNFALTPIVFTSYGQMLTRDGKEIPQKKRDANFVNRLQVSTTSDSDSRSWPTNGYWANATRTDLTAWQQYYRTLAAKTNLFPVPAQPQSPAADVLLALSKYDSTVKELREAAKLPYSRFPLEYDKDDPWAILLPHLSALKKCSQVLQLRALAELQNGQSDRALADVKLTLRLVDSIHTEPFLISHLVRIVMVNIALQPVWEGLAERQWSDAQLTELDAELAKLDFLADYKLAMRGGEMVLCQVAAIDNLRHHPERLPNMSDDNFSPPSLIKTACRLIPQGWFYQNQLHCARPMVEFYLPAVDSNGQTVSPSKIKKADEIVTVETRRPNAFNLGERLLLPALGSAARRFAYGQSSVDLARTAIALERYRLAHGEYPESLDVLAPRFIVQVPHDVIGGGPLHYRRTSDGQFVLYSVGWNETDDGGEVVFRKGSTLTVDISQGDWVWRYPQK